MPAKIPATVMINNNLMAIERAYNEDGHDKPFKGFLLYRKETGNSERPI